MSSNGWIETTLGDLSEPKVSQQGPTGADEFVYVDISSIDRNTKRITEPKTLPANAAPSRAKQVLSSGDVVISMTRPNLNAVALIPPELDGAIGSTGFHVLRTSKADPSLLFYAVQTNQFVDAMTQKVQGALYPAVRPKDVLSYPIRVPTSIDEQRTIVAEIEKQFTRLDAGVAALQRAQANLKRYRAAVLKAACEGKLVPTEAELAGAEGRSYESGAELLQRILAERRSKWNGHGKYKEPAAPNVSGLPALPAGWVWATIGEIFDVEIGSTPSRKRDDFWNGNIAWVSSGEVAFCRINTTRECITQLGFDNASLDIHPPGTVLIGMIGEGRTRGQVAILDIPACNNQNSAAIRVSETCIPPGYVYYFLYGQYERNRRLGSGNNQPALNKARVQTIQIPLPPAAEQQRIVVEVERRLSIIDEIEAAVSANLQRGRRLRQSVLQKAFSGDLSYVSTIRI